MAGLGALRIGTSGYQYDHWRGVLYEPSLPKRAWFARYTEVFDTVELNVTFYRVPTRETFAAWRAAAPAGFVYSLKFSRFATHHKKLLDPEATLAYFLDRAQPLLDRVGPILVQLPPRWSADPARLDAFLAAAPRHLRWAVEFRDPSWLRDDVFEVLRAHGAALCLHDALDHPWLLTADWTYLRFHGGPAGPYGRDVLRPIAERLVALREAGRDAFVYFNNDLGGHAVRDALALATLAGGARLALAP